MEDGPFNFDSYDDEDYYFDSDGAYARHYVFGGKEATSAVHKTLYEFRSAARRIAKATGQDPNRCDHLIEVPADAPNPKTSTATRPCGGYSAPSRPPGFPLGPPPNTTGSRPPWPAKTIPPSGPGPTTAPRYPSKIDTCTPHRTRPRRKSTRMTGLRRSWDATRRIQRRNPGGPTSSRKDAGPGANGYSTPGYTWSPFRV